MKIHWKLAAVTLKLQNGKQFPQENKQTKPTKPPPPANSDSPKHKTTAKQIKPPQNSILSYMIPITVVRNSQVTVKRLKKK